MGQRFKTTHWSLILAAQTGEEPEAQSALSELCEQYWFPLYSYVRRRGYPDYEAQDLTQEFFRRFLEKHYIQQVDRERGRFRSFLLACMKHFLADEWDKGQAQKRGGGQTKLSLDFGRAESLLAEVSQSQLTPDELYDRHWAQTLLARALRRLEEDHRTLGQSSWFAALKPALVTGKLEKSYRDIAGELGTSEGALRVAVHRLRKRYGELLQDEVSQTVHDEAEAETELKYLLSTL